MSFLKKIICTISIIFVCAYFGCGTATNNDQGVVFRALGFFSDSSGGSGQAGDITPLFTDSSFFQGVAGTGSTTAFDGRSLDATIGVENNLGTQFIRIERIDCEYSIQGSSLAVPDDSLTYTSSVDPASKSFQTLQMISPDILA